jgi:hypothetical protein
MRMINLCVGWVAVLVGMLGGAGIGLFFHGADWLGGYGSWTRRMLRLAHIACVGTGLLNICFALSASQLRLDPVPRAASVLFVVGAVTMPLVCALSAWRAGFRHLFFVPALALILAAADFIQRVWLR